MLFLSQHLWVFSHEQMSDLILNYFSFQHSPALGISILMLNVYVILLYVIFNLLGRIITVNIKGVSMNDEIKNIIG